MTFTRTIHHFDDQPEYIRWICGALRNRYGLMHPEWLGVNPIDDSDDWEVRFKLMINGQEWTVIHRVYGTPEQFRDEFPARARPGDVAFIDLMVGGEEDSTEFPGAALYIDAVGRLGADNVFFLTAYPKYLETLTGFRGAQLIIKPPDVTKLIGSIVTRLSFMEPS